MFIGSVMNSDKEKIEKLGGATELAKRLGYSVQRIQHWKNRGIPSAEKLKHPELFLIHKEKNLFKEPDLGVHERG